MSKEEESETYEVKHKRSKKQEKGGGVKERMPNVTRPEKTVHKIYALTSMALHFLSKKKKNK